MLKFLARIICCEQQFTTSRFVNSLKLIRFLLVAVVVSSFQSVQAAESKYLGIGISAFQNGDFVGAITAWEQAAQEGSIVAMYNLGRIYSDSEVGKVDFQKSLHWYEKSANSGHVGAQYNLGRMLIENNREIQNIPKAIDYWQLAASNGDIGSMQALASLYLIKNVPWHSEAQAIKYLDMAARAGDKASEDVLRALAQQIAKNQELAKNKPNDKAQLSPKPQSTKMAQESIKQHIESIGNTVAINGPKINDKSAPSKGILAPSNTASKQNKAGIKDNIPAQKPPLDMMIEFINTLELKQSAGKVNRAEQQRQLIHAETVASDGDLNTSIEILKSLASEGVVDAYIPLARFRLERDNALTSDALYYLSLSAQLGDREGQKLLGEYLTKSENVIEQSRGWYWLSRASAGGNNASQKVQH